VQITVLGKSPSWQDADGACSGYLVEHDGRRLLLDCGNGVFGKLRHYADYCAVDAVLITHMHADHFLDVVPFAYALTYAPRQQPVPIGRWRGTDAPARPDLYVPVGGAEVLRRVVGAWGNEDLVDNAFEVHEYDDSMAVEVGEMKLRFHLVPHYLTTHAVEVSSNGSGRFTFGADTRPTEDLVEFARDTDLLMVEATLPRPERDGVRGHLTATEAGDHGKRAGARRLVITHISDELDWDEARRQAEEAFGGPVDVAREGAVYKL
jgi:ribonuclease BN (tRNA processing enzyme)